MDDVLIVLLPTSVIQILAVVALVFVIISSIYQIVNERKRKVLMSGLESDKEELKELHRKEVNRKCRVN